MNNSISTPSAGLPTHWPERSFSAGATAALVLIAAGVAIVIGIIGAVVLFAHRQLLAGPNFVLTGITYQLLIEGVPVLVILVSLPRVSKLPLRELGFTVPKLWQIGVAVLGAIAMAVIVNGSAALIETLTHHKHEQSVVEMFKQVVGKPGIMWFFAFFAIVLAPFMEETIFRIFIFNAARRYGGFWIGALVSGLCFGAAHMDLFVLAPLTLGGMILCYVYYRTGNAFASMITHGLFNALTVFALIFAPRLAQ